MPKPAKAVAQLPLSLRLISVQCDGTLTAQSMPLVTRGLAAGDARSTALSATSNNDLPWQH